LKDRQYNGEKKTDEKTNNDLQNTNTENYRLSNTNSTEKIGIFLSFNPYFFCGIRVAQSLVFCVVFCRSLFVFSSVFFSPLYFLSFNPYTMAKRKQTKRQTMIYKTLHRKIKIEQHEPHRKNRD
jgi:hypothetical protein